MDDDIIVDMEAMAFSEGQQIIGRDGPLFEWKPVINIEKNNIENHSPPLNNDVLNYELVPIVEDKGAADEEVYSDDDEYASSKEDIIDDVNVIEDYVGADTGADATNPNVAPIVVPREDETWVDYESLTSTDTGSVLNTNQDGNEVCINMKTNHPINLRQGLPSRGKHRNVYEQEF